MRTCFHKIGLWQAVVHFLYRWLMWEDPAPTSGQVVLGGKIQLPHLGRWSWKQDAQAMGSKPVSFSTASTPAPTSRFCLEFLPWLPFAMTCNWNMQAETMPPKLLLVMVFIIAIETLRHQEFNIHSEAKGVTKSYQRSCIGLCFTTMKHLRLTDHFGGSRPWC